MLYRFRDIASCLSNVVDFSVPRLQLGAPAGGDAGGISPRSLAPENYRVLGLSCDTVIVLSRFSRTLTCDRQTDYYIAYTVLA